MIVLISSSSTWVESDFGIMAKILIIGIEDNAWVLGETSADNNGTDFSFRDIGEYAYAMEVDESSARSCSNLLVKVKVKVITETYRTVRLRRPLPEAIGS